MSLLDILHDGLIISALTSLGLTCVVVMTQQWHGKHSHDTLNGPQKFHVNPTPRVGGIPLFLALVVACCISPQSISILLCPMVIASLPAFAAGLVEDLTKRVSPRNRLLATMLSGVAAWWFTGYSITHLEITGVDSLLVYLPVSVAFTAFAVAGVAHAINMIDGFNGLASGTIMLLFVALGLIAMEVGDRELAQLCLTIIVVLTGFIAFNYPFGKIFLGDGGAYVLGFLLAWVAVMLPMRNPEVSVWAPLLVCAYPINEALFTMGRRYVHKVALGLIVATPTGSTAYSLSCTGPIITPDSENFVITPIASHNLTVRPIVVPDKSIIKIIVEGRGIDCYIGLDSRHHKIENSLELIIRKEDFTINLLRMSNKNFFQTIREKLKWGLDIRN